MELAKLRISPAYADIIGRAERYPAQPAQLPDALNDMAWGEESWKFAKGFLAREMFGAPRSLFDASQLPCLGCVTPLAPLFGEGRTWR